VLTPPAHRRALLLDSECIETPRDLVRVMKWLGALAGKALEIREIKAGSTRWTSCHYWSRSSWVAGA